MRAATTITIVPGLGRAPVCVRHEGRPMSARTPRNTTMRAKKLRICATMVVACQLSLFGTPSHASDDAGTTAEPLPTVVVGPPRGIEYPQPICAKCKVVAERETAATGQSHGLL